MKKNIWDIAMMFIKLLLNKNLIINSQNRPKSWTQLLSKKMMEFKLGVRLNIHMDYINLHIKFYG